VHVVLAGGTPPSTPSPSPSPAPSSATLRVTANSTSIPLVGPGSKTSITVRLTGYNSAAVRPLQTIPATATVLKVPANAPRLPLTCTPASFNLTRQADRSYVGALDCTADSSSRFGGRVRVRVTVRPPGVPALTNVTAAITVQDLPI
jgi:hypothetical protein